MKKIVQNLANNTKWYGIVWFNVMGHYVDNHPSQTLDRCTKPV